MPSQTITQAGACPRASRARALSCDDRSCPDRERVPEAAEWIDRPHVFAELKERPWRATSRAPHGAYAMTSR
jgi:hypothetical protein